MMVGGGLLLLVAGTGLVLVTRQRRSRTTEQLRRHTRHVSR